MIIKNNKKCNIKINDKNIETYKKINISDLKYHNTKVIYNGIKFDSIYKNKEK